MGIHLALTRAWRRVLLGISLAVVPGGFGAVTMVAPSGAVASHRGPRAIVARTLSLSLTTKLHLVGRPGRVLSEQGSISGTLAGAAYARNTALSSTRGEGRFTFYPKGGGSMSGEASTSGHVVGARIYFTGTARVTGGTGVWAHASSSNMHYSGFMERQNFRVTDHLTGTLRY